MNYEDIPKSTQRLAHNSETGISGCVTCGWRGVPVPHRPDECPACQLGAETDAEYEALVEKSKYAGTPRNAPCPCGSGRKWKKCHGA